MKNRVLKTCLTALALSAAGLANADPVSLGSASQFTVLSASGAVNCTNSTIEGDVGSAVAGTKTGCMQSGEDVTPVSQDIQTDFNTAYSALAVEQCDNTLTTLAGQVLQPGTYCVDNASTNTGSVLTLDGDASDTWLFKIGASGAGALTGTDFVVNMSGGAEACNVTWWVADAVTLTRGDFKGDILAGKAVTVTGVASNSPVKGRVMANGTVVMTNADVLGCVAEAAARTEEAIAAALAAKLAAEAAEAAALLAVVTNVVDDVIGPNGENVIGAQGEPGIAGADGNDGTNGTNGAVGATGKNGPVGKNGADGAVGATGKNGPVGKNGADGAVGATGKNGPVGKNGADGAVGATGKNGPVGKNGADGAVGATGKNGPVGKNGADGADGIMYDGAFEGDMQYWNGNAWIMITAPTENAGSLSFCDGQPTWTQGECPVYYEIGDQGPAGGIVFYVSNEGLNGLEAAPADQGRVMWGCYSTPITGANGTAVGTGEQNTADIIAGCDETTAASVASAYGPGWYLPSRDELNLILVNICCKVGGISHADYWSSSQISDSFAWGIQFSNDIQYKRFKGHIFRVRAVRAF
jgi:hypothetical protein